MRRALFLSALLIGFAANAACGQELPFTVTVIGWDRDVHEHQRREYRSAAEDGEVLFCIETWTTSSSRAGLESVVIMAARRARFGERHRLRDVAEQCLGKDGKPLPTLHTHSDGNCQFSPADLITVVARAAPFEVVQCGERHFVYAFAWQIVAIATSFERERLSRTGTLP